MVNKKKVTSKRISELYYFSKSMKGKNAFSKDEIISIYKMMTRLGIFDKTIDKSNKFFRDIIERHYEGLDSTNPFIIEDSQKDKFMEDHFYSLETKEEIVANELTLANRLSKMTQEIACPPRSKEVVNGKKKVTYSILGWDAYKYALMKDMYKLYESNLKEGGWNFLEDVEFDSNGNINNEYFKKVKGDNLVEVNNEEYSKFYQWFQTSWSTLVGQLPYYRQRRLKTFSDEDIAKFQMYARLKYSEPIFYELKNDGIMEILKLSKNGNVKVFNATQVGKKSDNRDRKINSEERLIRIEIAGYNAPFLPHCFRDQFIVVYGIDLDNSKVIDTKRIEYSWEPIFNFKMNDDQKAFIQPINLKEGIDDESYGQYKDVITYMKESAHEEYRAKIKKEREEKRKSLSEKNNEDEGQEKTTVQEEVTKLKPGENKTKNPRSKENIKEDEPFIDEDIIKFLEEKTSIQFKDNYREALLQKKNKTKLNSVYIKIENFIKQKLENESDETKKLESAKMFVYMRLTGKKFWNIANISEERKEEIAEMCTPLFEEYDNGYQNIVDSIQRGIAPSELKNTGKSRKGKENSTVSKEEDIKEVTEKSNNEEKIATVETVQQDKKIEKQEVVDEMEKETKDTDELSVMHKENAALKRDNDLLNERSRLLSEHEELITELAEKTEQVAAAYELLYEQIKRVEDVKKKCRDSGIALVGLDEKGINDIFERYMKSRGEKN